MPFGKFFWNQSLNSTSNNRAKDRCGSFSLIHLEPNEYVLEDYSSSVCISSFIDPVNIDNKIIQKANFVNSRLWICSHSLVIERSNMTASVNEPIIRIPFQNVSNVLYFDASYSIYSNNSSTKPGLMYISCKSYTEVLSGHKLQCTQYQQMRNESTFLISFHYVLTRTVCNLINETWSNSINVDINYSNPDQYFLKQALNKPKGNSNESESFEYHFLNTQRRSFTFDRSMLDDICEEFLFETNNCWLCEPLVRCAGSLTLTNKRLYFAPFRPGPCGSQNVRINLNDIKVYRNRRYLLNPVACEIIYSSKNCFNVVFSQRNIRDSFVEKLMSVNLNVEFYLFDKAPYIDEKVTNSWRIGEISNYDYLLALNLAGDRSFYDLSQYPVFPWIISDYTSEEAHLDDVGFYRDLRLPIGALNRKRLKDLKRKAIIKKEMELELSKERIDDSQSYSSMNNLDATSGSYLYGSHYSSPAMVLYFLVRVAPEHALCVQGGRFDVADRLFSSMQTTWSNCTSHHSDFKELIPEFYDSDGEIFKNSLKLDFGSRQDGLIVNDVILPPWAKNNPKLFVETCRKALEHPIVSANLHNWIDIIFGYKQKGSESWLFNNVFHPLTYEGSIDLQNMKNNCLKNCLETQILEFGQCPRQLFTHPHPPKCKENFTLHTTYLKSFSTFNQDCSIQNFNSSDDDDDNNETCTDSKKSTKKDHNEFFDLIPVKTITNHSSQLINSIWISPDAVCLIAITQDGCISIHDLVNESNLIKTYKVSEKPLTCLAVLRNQWDTIKSTYTFDLSNNSNNNGNKNNNTSHVINNNCGLMVLLTGYDQILRLCNVNTGSQKTIEVFNEMVECLSIDGFWLAIGCLDGSIHLYHYDIQSNPIVFNKYSLIDHTSAIKFLQIKVSCLVSLSINFNNLWLISSDNDCNLTSWNVNIQSSNSIKCNDSINFIKWSSSSNYILTCSDSGEISIFEWSSKMASFSSSKPLIQCRFGDRKSPINWFPFSTEKKSFENVIIYAWMGDASEIVIWNWKSMKIENKILINSVKPCCLDIMDNVFACATMNGQISIWAVIKKLI